LERAGTSALIADESNPPFPKGQKFIAPSTTMNTAGYYVKVTQLASQAVLV
jgi:hypothetical protein